MRLKRMEIRNFKGFTEHIFEPDGKNVAVLGPNASGKTTLMDAYLWTWTGKDSLDQANFEPKPIIDGEPVHLVDYEVELLLSDDSGEKTTLRRVLQEKYTKRRGTSVEELTGNKTQYFVDDVPMSEREYQSRLSQTASPQLFRLLSDVRYFNEVMTWQDRRKLLLSICGDVTDDEVIGSDSRLAELTRILGRKTVDDWKSIAKARQSEMQTELGTPRKPGTIQTRIDEASRGMFEVPAGSSTWQLKDQIRELEAEKTAKQAERSRIENGGEIAQKKKALALLEGELQALNNNLAQIGALAQANHATALRKAETALAELRNTQATKRATRSFMVTEIERLQKQVEDLRFDWMKEQKTEFGICWICGQTMPGQKLTEYNNEKAERLKGINANGKTLKATILQKQQEQDALTAAIDQLSADIEAASAQIATMKPAEALESEEAQANRKRVTTGIEILNSALSELALGSHDALSVVDGEIEAIEAKTAPLRTLLSNIESNQRANLRIKELTEQRKKVAAEYEQIEKGLMLCETFTRSKVSMLDSKINSKFTFCQFRLFIDQVNGGLQETCETMHDGIPYRNLNEAAKISAGCEMAEVLSEHSGVWLPRWIDGAESILDIPASRGQVITLVVSGDHPKLTVVEA